MAGTAAKLEGFGGWLLLIAFGQWLGVFGALGRFMVALPDNARQWGDPIGQRTMIGEAALDLGLIAFMLYTAIVMTMKGRGFPTLFRIETALFVVVPLLSIWWGSASTGMPLDKASFAATVGQAIVGTIGASLSILYSLRSARVRNTFVN